MKVMFKLFKMINTTTVLSGISSSDFSSFSSSEALFSSLAVSLPALRVFGASGRPYIKISLLSPRKGIASAEAIISLIGFSFESKESKLVSG